LFATLETADTAIRQLKMCWNNVFRKVFSFKKYEPVKELQYCYHNHFTYLISLLSNSLTVPINS